MVCSSNQKRSMEAHVLLNRQGLDVASYGTGSHVKTTWTVCQRAKRLRFRTPYKHMFDELRRKDPSCILFSQILPSPRLIFVLIGFGFGLGFLLNFHMRNVSFSPQLFRLSSPSLSPQLQPQPENLVIANETVVPEGQKGHSPVEFEKVKHHIMTEEEELMWRALEVQERPSTVKKKWAFMFLTRGKLPLAKLWERFFNGHQGLFSVYVHTSNLSYVDDGIPETSPFYRRRIPSKLN
ncbi:uncharacterized protein LOC125594931 [Brassica napus]|uniref:uncharacterized protein LOC125594931 n=1 Tax=Brassica napus TaxID=3708 RepID=UPI002078B1A4|nr:uncharacterized protein LOC125594931 [Brassica napus]